MRKLLKTSKKTLAILMAVMMLLSVAAPAAFAADACDHNFVNKATVEPNCTERGYTIQVCTKCEAVRQTNYVNANGHSYEKDENGKPIGVYVPATCTQPGGTHFICTVCNVEVYVDIDENAPATGHNMSDWYFVDYENGYAKERYCQNDGCTESEYEKTGEDVNKYFKVEFYNNFVSPKGDEGHYVEVDGTTLAINDENVYIKKLLETQYVLSGSKAEYTGETPLRESTKDCGEYAFSGWSASLESVEANTVAEAVFDETTKVYNVTFVKTNGTQYTKDQPVIHGTAAQYPYDNNPTKADDMYNHYEFAGWSRNGKIITSDATPISARKIVADTPIYSSGIFVEYYNKIPKNFKVIFCDIGSDGEEYEIASTTGVHFGMPLINVPSADAVRKATDATYRYEFSGKWKFANGDYANLMSFAFFANDLQEYDPANEADEKLTDAQKGIIKLYPEYYTQTVQYSFKLVVTDADGYTPAGNGTVQILDASHQFVTAKKLVGYDDVENAGTAVFTLSYKPVDVETQASYIIQAVCNGNVKEVKVQCYFLRDADGTYRPYVKLVDGKTSSGCCRCPWENNGVSYPEFNIVLEEDSVDHNGEVAPHSCICHTFLATPWITMLRIINSIFGRKYVCCPDMYERHGNIYGD